MSAADSNSSSAAQAATQPSAVRPFRFSLLTLLSAMTLAAVTSAVLFSRHWHADERLLMAFWCAGLLIGTSFGRARGTHGIYSGALGAVVGCLIAAFMFDESLYPLSGTSTYESGLLAPYLMFVVVCGWPLAIFAAAVYHAAVQGVLERWFQRYVSIRSLIVGGGLLVVIVVAWQLLAARSWLPRAETSFSAGKPGFSTFATLSLADNGNVFVAYSPFAQVFGNPAAPRLYRLQGGRLLDEELRIPFQVRQLALSPNGQQVALYGDHEPAIFLFDLSQQQVTREAKLNIPSSATLSHLRFSADGNHLFATTTSPRIQRFHVIDVADQPAASAQLFPFAGQLFCSSSGQLLVKVISSNDETDEASAEIIHGTEQAVLHRLTDVRLNMAPIFSPDERRVALGNRVWDRSTGETLILPGEVVGFTARGDAVVMRKNLRQKWPGFLPPWLMRMPFVRHLYSPDEFGQLVLIDQATGKTVAATEWLSSLKHANVSGDGHVVASCSAGGTIRLWTVPKVR
ncbi:hypothetical protein ETAA8_08570 [Anatilimnocola aggregata]|uniref:WD40 repeat domain-containing protein n=1 Tax=Anatilimnocola aggregata TaxID=2528021 RepID=A0A517Y6E5_9BACT|nr:WD40 repeat domain-containing protein [Anatilimnocola aggregata]QDU25786.1 hypothetical protein ETAA8_08570 [Anatilimnocola aggregata]